MENKSITRAPPKNHILIVEDSPTQAAKLAMLLENEGYEVAVAINADDARNLLEENSFDLVLSDIHMPGDSGFELCRYIKGNRDFDNVIVVLLTGHSDADYVVRGLSAGADFFLTKGHVDDVFLGQIKRLIQRRFQRQETKELETPPTSIPVEKVGRHRAGRMLANALEDIREIGGALQKSRHQIKSTLEAVLNTIPVGVVVMRADGTVRQFNRAACALLGADGPVPLGEWFEKFGFLESDGVSLDPSEFPTVKTLEDGNSRMEVELFIERPGTDAIPVLVNTQPIHDEDGKLEEVITTFTAITERKKVDTIRERLIELDRLAAFGHLAGGIAHEINNPAAFVSANLEIVRKHHCEKLGGLVSGIEEMAETESDPERREKLLALLRESEGRELFEDLESTIEENLDGMKRITMVVGELRSYASPSATSSSLVATDLNETVEVALKMIRREQRQGVRFEAKLAPSPVWILAQPMQLIQSVVKLLGHAGHQSEAAHGESTVVITTASNGTRATIEVISDDLELSKVEELALEPGQETVSDPTALSVGLAICSVVVESFKGILRVGDTQCGPCIEAVFPLITPPEDENRGGGTEEGEKAGDTLRNIEPYQ